MGFVLYKLCLVFTFSIFFFECSLDKLQKSRKTTNLKRYESNLQKTNKVCEVHSLNNVCVHTFSITFQILCKTQIQYDHKHIVRYEFSFHSTHISHTKTIGNSINSSREMCASSACYVLPCKIPLKCRIKSEMISDRKGA